MGPHNVHNVSGTHEIPGKGPCPFVAWEAPYPFIIPSQRNQQIYVQAHGCGAAQAVTRITWDTRGSLGRSGAAPRQACRANVMSRSKVGLNYWLVHPPFFFP